MKTTSANVEVGRMNRFSPRLILGFVFAFALAIVLLCAVAWCLFVTSSSKTFSEPEMVDFRYLQHLPSPDKKHVFALYADYTVLIGDTGWYIFKFEEGVDVEDYQITWEEYRRGAWRAKVIVSNYAEDGDHTENPHIEIIDDRYLAFMRGGLYHSLYDIKTDKILVNYVSPWHEWRDSEEYHSIQPGPSEEERKRSIDEWKRKALHEPILRIIQGE